MAEKLSRRTFFEAAAGSGVLPLTARAYSRIRGANDRIQIGQIGCGHRGRDHRQMLKLSAQTDPNFDLRGVCDLWSVNRERAAVDAQRLFGTRPKTTKYPKDWLGIPNLDRVLIPPGISKMAEILAELVGPARVCSGKRRREDALR